MINEKWFAHMKVAQSPRMNIICFPYVGGSPSFYAPWKRLLPKNVGWFPVLLPGREARIDEEITNNISDLIKIFIKDNQDLLKQAPVVFMGHCTGTILAYETARLLKKDLKREPLLVVLSSALDPDTSTQKLLESISFNRLVNKTKEELIIEFLTSHQMIPSQVMEMEGFCDYFLPIYVEDLKMFMSYKAEKIEKLNSRALVLYGNEDTMMTENLVQGWKKYFTGDVQIVEKNGDHYFINNCRKEVVSMIFEVLKEGGLSFE